MPGAIRNLCRRYGYPSELEDALERVVDAAREAYPKLRSFILSGSAATGEFVWRRNESAVELLSDIDGMLFVEFDGAHPEGLLERLRALEAQQRSPLFQIDVVVNPMSALRRIPKNYQMVETRLSGVVLAGEDVRDAFPTEYDPANSRQAFLLNLWKPILFWTPPGTEHDFTYAQVAARFFLDLPLIGVSETGRCLPGHRERAEWFLASSSSSRFHSPLTEEVVSWARAVRLEPHPHRSDLERLIARFAFEVTAMIDGLGEPPRDPDLELVRRLVAWLPRRTPRRLAGELRSLLRAPRNPLDDLRWLACRKEAVGAAALLGLHAFLSDGGLGEPPSGIAARLREFSRERISPSRDLAFIQEAKNAYWAGLCDLYPSMRQKGFAYAPLLEAVPRQ